MYIFHSCVQQIYFVRTYLCVMCTCTQIYILLNIRQTVKKHLISDSFQAQFDILRLQYHACFVFGAIDMQ